MVSRVSGRSGLSLVLASVLCAALYIFEVASAGAERPLKRPGDFEQFMGSPVLLKTYKPVDGRKEFSGDLAGYEDGAVTLRIGEEERRFEKDTVALVRLRCDF